jgi:cytidylate kinase
MNPPNLAIDGPASSGKGSVARRVAARLGYTYVDTGAMYRVVALWALESGVGLHDGPGLAEGISTLNLRFDTRPEDYRVWMGDREVTLAIRRPNVGDAASLVSAHPEVRSALVKLQRGLAESGGMVMDGRDIGTVVLPHARFKVYLEASLDERARRRFMEDSGHDAQTTLNAVRAALAERDRRDMNREASPLKKADGAWAIDSTEMTIDEVVQEICDRVLVEMDGGAPP